MAPPISPRRTRTKNATQRPGLVVLKGQNKRRTKAQIAQDKQDTLEAQAIKEATLQCGIDRIARIEAAMEVEQATQATKRAKPVKLRAKPVKIKASAQGATSELTSENPLVPPAQVKVRDAGHHTKDNEVGSVGVGAGSDKVIGNEEIVNEAVKVKKKKKVNPTISRDAIMFKLKLFLATLSGISSTRTSQTVATTVSLAKGPPLSLTDSSETSQALTSDDDKDEGGDEDPSEVADEDDDYKDNDFKEHLLSLKGKGGMQSVVAITGEITQAESSEDETPETPVSTSFNSLPFTQQADIVRFALEQARSTHTVSSKKRPIDSVDLIGSSEDLDATDEYNPNTSFDAMLLDDADIMSPEVEPSPKPAPRITSKTSVTVHGNPNPPKKAKLEPTSQIISIPASSEPDLMSADTMTRPKGGTQWRKSDLPPIMLVDGIWRRSFMPTVLLWAGAQPNFWSMETEHLLPALQAIFDVAYPGTHHNVQPKGPIIGLGMQAVIAACAASLERAFNFVAKPKALSDGQSIGTSSTKGIPARLAKPPSSAINPAAKIATGMPAFSEANCGLATMDTTSPSRGRGPKYTMDVIALVHQRREAAQKLKNAPVRS
ncbi:hypothetical protein DFH29DRAFT_880366 [Suillus ampliporus]|nr:hypothetical protein DFH29DRAFT_880366 [Suillus ampliporus]